MLVRISHRPVASRRSPQWAFDRFSARFVRHYCILTTSPLYVRCLRGARPDGAANKSKLNSVVHCQYHVCQV
jgi:hypothetical protein